MTRRRLLWLCPFPIPTIPPPDLPSNVEFTECHRLDEALKVLEGLESPRFDAVVVDTSPAEGHGYDPVDIMALLAAKCVSPPRYLVAVVKPGLNMDPIDSQVAFAVEMQYLWQHRRPVLIIEEAVLYYLEEAPTETSNLKRQKDHSVGQVRRWATIADRTIKLAESKLAAQGRPVPPLTRALVAAVCAESKPQFGPYFNQTHRALLFELARHRHSVKALAEVLRYSENFIRRSQKQISEQLYSHSEQADHRVGRPDHAAFCNELINSYGPWLLSRSRRSSPR